MPEAIAPKNEAIDRLVTMFRDRLESAFANGQRVTMSAREGARSRTIPTTTFEQTSLTKLLQAVRPDGSFELHVYIDPKHL